MVFSVKENQPVGIVQPTLVGSEMKLRAIWFVILRSGGLGIHSIPQGECRAQKYQCNGTPTQNQCLHRLIPPLISLGCPRLQRVGWAYSPTVPLSLEPRHPAMVGEYAHPTCATGSSGTIPVTLADSSSFTEYILSCLS